MIYYISNNFLKLLNKIVKSDQLTNKINRFNLTIAYQTINKLFEVKKKKFTNKQIKNLFFQRGIKLNFNNDGVYIKLLDLIIGEGDLKKNKNFFENFFKNLTPLPYQHKSWMRLRDILYLKSQIFLGGLCREQSINSVVKSKSSFFLSHKDRARAMLERFLKNKINTEDFKLFPFEKYLNKRLFNNFIRIFFEDINIKIRSDKDQEDFINFLKNKNIAIVGPAAIENNNASEIDSYDVVIRLNYTFSGKNLDEFHKGLKVDISYYNGEQIDHIIKNNNCRLPADLAMICIKDNSFKRFEKIKKVNPKKIIKKVTNYNALNFYSSLNLLPITLLDILASDVKSIKVFHSDLFITTMRNSNYYPRAFKREKLKQTKVLKESFLNHDPMMHHILLKRIYQNSKIIGDDSFDRVMKMETHEYLKKLSDLYQ